jgi:hypothetical protein
MGCISYTCRRSSFRPLPSPPQKLAGAIIHVGLAWWHAAEGGDDR